MYKLTRINDGLVKEAKDILYVCFNEDKTFKSESKEISVGSSLLLAPFNMYHTWLTTEITVILEAKEGYWKFITKNSIYELIKEG
jgi:hypothetical protein